MNQARVVPESPMEEWRRNVVVNVLNAAVRARRMRSDRKYGFAANSRSWLTLTRAVSILWQTETSHTNCYCSSSGGMSLSGPEWDDPLHVFNPVYRLVVDNESCQSQCDLEVPHTEYGTTHTCRKCRNFCETYVQVNPASTAKRVPKWSTANPHKFLNEHLYPTFTGNTATKYGKENEEKAIQLIDDQGHTVEWRGLLVWPDLPWFAARPEGILDPTQLHSHTYSKDQVSTKEHHISCRVS